MTDPIPTAERVRHEVWQAISGSMAQRDSALKLQRIIDRQAAILERVGYEDDTGRWEPDRHTVQHMLDLVAQRDVLSSLLRSMARRARSRSVTLDRCADEARELYAELESLRTQLVRAVVPPASDARALVERAIARRTAGWVTSETAAIAGDLMALLDSWRVSPHTAPTLAATRTGSDFCSGCGEVGTNRTDNECCGTCGKPLLSYEDWRRSHSAATGVDPGPETVVKPKQCAWYGDQRRCPDNTSPDSDYCEHHTRLRISACGTRMARWESFGQEDQGRPVHGTTTPPVAGDRVTGRDLDGQSVAGVLRSYFAWSPADGRNTRAYVELADGARAVCPADSLAAEVLPDGGEQA